MRVAQTVKVTKWSVKGKLHQGSGMWLVAPGIKGEKHHPSGKRAQQQWGPWLMKLKAAREEVHTAPWMWSAGNYLESPFEESNLVNFSLINLLHVWLVLTD